MTTNKSFPGLGIVGSDLFCTYRDGFDHVGINSERGALYYKTRALAGGAWSTATQFVADATLDCRDPVVLVHSSGAILVTFYYYDGSDATGAKVARSADDGDTWDEYDITASFTTATKHAVSGMAVELPNGDILVAARGIDTGDTFRSVRVSRSQDDGVTWEALSEIADGETDSLDYTECSLVILSDGTLGAMIRCDTDVVYRWATSDDDGATWSALTDLAWNDDPSGRPGLFLTSDDILICTYRAKGADWDGRYRVSDDDGATWSPYTVLHRGVDGVNDFYAYTQMVEHGGDVLMAEAYEDAPTSATVYLNTLTDDPTSL